MTFKLDKPRCAGEGTGVDAGYGNLVTQRATSGTEILRGPFESFTRTLCLFEQPYLPQLDVECWEPLSLQHISIGPEYISADSLKD